MVEGARRGARFRGGARDTPAADEVPSIRWAFGSPHLGPTRRDPIPLAGSPTVPIPPTFLAEIEPGLAGTRLPVRGRPELLAAIADHVGRTSGVALDPTSDVVVTNGAMHALDCVFRALVPRDGTVGMVCPTFFVDGLLRDRARLVRFDTDPREGWHLTDDVVERVRASRLDVLYLANPNNPTGVVYSAHELQALLDATAHAGTLIVVDEAYEAFVYDDRRHASLFALDRERERVLTVQSFTKSFGLVAARIGCVFGPARLLEPVVRLLGWVTLASNPLPQALALAALQHADMWRPRLLEEFVVNRQRLAAAVEDGALPSATPIPEGATFAALATASWGRGSEYAARRLWQEAGIACVPGIEFPGDPAVTDRFVRLPFGARPEAFEQVLDRLGGVFA